MSDTAERPLGSRAVVTDPARPDLTAHAALEISRGCASGRIRMLSRAVTCVYDDELRDVGIRTGQLTLLGVVAAHGRITQAAMEHCLLMDGSTVSRTVRRMCDHGWLTTEPSEDARSHYLVITEDGTRVLERALPAWRRAQLRARELLGSDGFDSLMALGDGVLKRLG